VSDPPRKAQGGTVVDRVCFALPILEGKTEDARAFFEELEAQRKDAYAASERRINSPRRRGTRSRRPRGASCSPT